MNHLSRTGTRVVLETLTLMFSTRSPLGEFIWTSFKVPSNRILAYNVFAAPLNLIFSTLSPLDLESEAVRQVPGIQYAHPTILYVVRKVGVWWWWWWQWSWWWSSSYYPHRDDDDDALSKRSPPSHEWLKLVEKVWFDFLVRSLYIPNCKRSPPSHEWLKLVEKVWFFILVRFLHTQL